MIAYALLLHNRRSSNSLLRRKDRRRECPSAELMSGQTDKAGQLADRASLRRELHRKLLSYNNLHRRYRPVQRQSDYI